MSPSERKQLAFDCWSRSFDYENYVTYCNKAKATPLPEGTYNDLYEKFTSDYQIHVEEESMEPSESIETSQSTWYAVYLYNSPEPTKIFKGEAAARQWGTERDPDCEVRSCTVIAERIKRNI